MIVTINTDASFHPQHKVGAFAFWIVCNQGKIMHSGPLKETKNPQDAEIRSIANALYVLLQSKFTGITKIIINTDCKFGINEIKMVNGKKLTPAKRCRDILDQLAVKYNLNNDQPYEFRYVPAHKNTSSPRTWVNDWCDKAAKKMMWEKVNNTKQQVK